MKAIHLGVAVAAVATVATLGACGSDDETSCDPATNAGCAVGFQCETVVQRSPMCLPPVVLAGRVLDAATRVPVVGARVLAQGADGVALAPASLTLADGSYQIRVSAPRDFVQKPLPQKLSVAVNAIGYASFPNRWRTATTLDLSGAVANAPKDKLVLSSSASEIALEPFGGGPGRGVLHGHVALPATKQPVLVVAEAGPAVSFSVRVSCLVDSDGAYRLVGLPPGAYTLRALAKGRSYAALPFSLNPGEETSLDVPASGTATVTVAGSGQVPAGAGAPAIALVAASTYDPRTGAGDSPKGLSAVLGTDGRFAIAGVPAGRYVVVPSPDDDGLVPAGALTTIDVGGADVEVPGPQRLVTAVTILGPGATGPSAATSAPKLSWQDRPDDEGYHLRVVTSTGTTVWERDVPKQTMDPSVAYSGPLVAGTFYRFQVQALDAQGQPFTSSEDGRGIFYAPAPAPAADDKIRP